VTLPDRNSGFVKNSLTSAVDNPLKKLLAPKTETLYDKPDSLAARKAVLTTGESIHILWNYMNYYFVTTCSNNGWIKKQ
jgi:hypothetical protein